MYCCFDSSRVRLHRVLCAVSIIQLMLKFLLAYQEGHYIAPRVVLYAYDTISIVYANTSCTLTCTVLVLYSYIGCCAWEC